MATVFCFGPYRADITTRRLTRDGTLVALPDRHFDVLRHLLERAGELVSKEALVEAAWPDVAVTDNSLEQAISTIRRAIGHAAEAPLRIETVPRRGYRAVGEVVRRADRQSDAAIDALLLPHRAWLEGRAALETMSVEQLAAAEQAFDRVLAVAPDHAAAHVGLANALAFRFESTRADVAPDRDALRRAVTHAREACAVDAAWGEAWATLGFALHRSGDGDSGRAAARRAVDLEPDNWRHHLRLAFVSWGEARLQAAHRALALLPDLAMAHWLAATVLVARGSLMAAEREATAGTAAQDRAASRFGCVGLYWLLGLLRWANGDARAAREALERELSFETRGHLYGRECAAHTCYALGAIDFHDGRAAEARHWFEQALARVPSFAPAVAAAGALEYRGALVLFADALAGRVDETPRDEAGTWWLPVEPLLRPALDPARWTVTLATLRAQAA